jgi:Clustered mitochondria
MLLLSLLVYLLACFSRRLFAFWCAYNSLGLSLERYFLFASQVCVTCASNTHTHTHSLSLELSRFASLFPIGGDKYIVNSILFKFAVDSNSLFNDNDYAAAKVGGHELKGLLTYFSLGLTDVHVPLMALVDYRGFRLIAMAVLPLQGNTLIYGSNDAGR